MPTLTPRSKSLSSLVLFTGAFAIASCAKPTHIEKEAVEPDDAKVEATSQLAPGGLAAPLRVEANNEAPPSISALAPKHVEKAPAPAAKQWDDAESIAIHAKDCDVRRIDSFVRVKCKDGNRIEQLAGDVRSVSFGCYAVGDPKCAVFRLQPGDKRVLQFSDASFMNSGGWGGGGLTLDKVAVVSAWWPKGATEPKITVD